MHGSYGIYINIYDITSKSSKEFPMLRQNITKIHGRGAWGRESTIRGPNEAVVDSALHAGHAGPCGAIAGSMRAVDTLVVHGLTTQYLESDTK